MQHENRIRVGIVGATGYAGVEATWLLSQHPGVELTFLTGDRWQGETARSRLGAPCELRYAPHAEAAALAATVTVVLVATPVAVAHALVPELLERGPKIIDLSGAFRLRDPAAYPSWHGFAHQRPDLLSEAVYGLPELNRSPIPSARLVANPGCYATAAALPLAPLVQHNLIVPSSIVVNAASGASGAGRQSDERYSFATVSEDYRAYRVLRHHHTPEIAQTIGAPLVFTPHLLPVRRGILCTTVARLTPGHDLRSVSRRLEESFASEPFVRLQAQAEAVSLRPVVGTNQIAIGAAVDGEQLVIVSAIDNLVKGAAGQAVQNLNLLFGLPPTMGLDRLRSYDP